MRVDIENPKDDRVALYRERRDGALAEAGLVLVDGAKNVERVLALGVPLVSILARPEYFASQSFSAETECLQVSAGILNDIIGYRYHQGVIGLAKRPEERSPLELGDRIVCFNDLVDAENVGAIVRSAHALGATGLLVGKGACSPYVRRAVRVSMASVFSLGVCHSDDVIENLSILASRGYRIFGADIHGASALPIDTKTEKTILVLGNEDRGLSPDIQKSLHESVRIPMVDSIDSLNVSHAAALLMWELFGKHLC